jgi:hypothetical protein
LAQYATVRQFTATRTLPSRDEAGADDAADSIATDLLSIELETKLLLQDARDEPADRVLPPFAFIILRRAHEPLWTQGHFW